MTRIICADCGRACNAERTEERGTGFCGCGLLPHAALARAHFGEEPCISGKRGSGTVFFCGCSLGCVFCQNYEISHDGAAGKEITPARLADIFRELEDSGVHNINLVNPTHYTYAIDKAMRLYRPGIPVVYNTSSYDGSAALARAAEWTDIFLADLKLVSPSRSRRYLKAENYPETALKAIDAMKRMQPKDEFASDGIMQRGVIVRVLLLPCNADQARACGQMIKERWGADTVVSVMSQYYPAGEAAGGKYPEIARRITAREYESVCACFSELGFSKGYYQKPDSADSVYTPIFNGEGI